VANLFYGNKIMGRMNEDSMEWKNDRNSLKQKNKKTEEKETTATKIQQKDSKRHNSKLLR